MANWTRMSSASPPAMAKNTSAPSRYMMPMRLWSTVATHDHRVSAPVTCGAGATRSIVATPTPALRTDVSRPGHQPGPARRLPAARLAPAAGRSALRGCTPSLQALQVARQRLDVGVGQLEVRHVGARLDALRIAQPALHV